MEENVTSERNVNVMKSVPIYKGRLKDSRQPNLNYCWLDDKTPLPWRVYLSTCRGIELKGACAEIHQEIPSVS